MSGMSFATATALWGRYEPTETCLELAESCCRHALAEGHLSRRDAEMFIEEQRRKA